MKRLRAIASAALGLITAICFAHSDTVLKLDSGGQLAGLPPEYAPASLRVVFSRSNEPDVPPVSSLELKVGGKTVVVPQCVTALVLTRSMKDVRVLASWYHDLSRHPPYLAVSLFDPGKAISRPGYTDGPGYTLRFNLSTVKLVAMEVTILRDGNSLQDVPVDIWARCSVSELQEFAEGRLRPNTSLERTRER